MNYKIVIFILLLLTIIISPSFALYFVLKIKIKTFKIKLLITVLTMLQIGILYAIFSAVYPPDSFYLEELEMTIGKKSPASAKILRKCASYPDQFGDYASVSTIKLSDGDYNRLRKEILLRKDFGKAELIFSDTLNEILDYETNKKSIFWRQQKISGTANEFHYIGFISNKKNVIIYRISY